MKSMFLTATAIAAIVSVGAAAQDRSVSMSGIAVDYRGETTGNGDFSGAAVDVSGSFGGDLEVSGGAVDVDASVGGDLDASGGAIDLRGRFDGYADISGGAVDIDAAFGSRVSISAGAIDVSQGSSFADDLDLAAGAADLNGTYSGEIDADFGELEFGGRAMGVVNFEGDKRSGIFRRRERSEIYISGALDAGGNVCAHQVTFMDGASVGGTLNVRADSEPIYPAGFDASNIRFEMRDGDCD